MEINIIKENISLEELKEISIHQFGDMVKFVVDIEREIIALGGSIVNKIVKP